jgi:hypothetical protein
MRHLQPEYVGLIDHLNEDNFKYVIREFVKEYFDTTDIRIKDGPYDGGNDLEIYKDGSQIMRNTQVTVQKKNIEGKLNKDLAKAKNNATDMGYDKILDFYCTIPMSGTQIDSYKKNARLNYGIELNIFDSNALAALSDSYLSIRTSILEVYNIADDQKLLNVNKHTKVLYDMFAIGKDAGELKRQFLHSLIITFIFENPNCEISNICEGLKSALNEDGQLELLIQSQIDRLRAKGVVVTGAEKNQVDISKEQKDKLQEILDAANSQEGLLKAELVECLTPYKLENKIKEIIDFIYSSFQANYEADLEELSGNSNHNTTALRNIYSDLLRFIAEKVQKENNPKEIARKVLDVCTSNTYLNKISASILFTKLFQSNKLEKYITQHKQIVFLDTQILLRLICLDIEKIQLDVFVSSVEDLTNAIEKYQGNIIMQTSQDYIFELTKQIHDALKLDRLFRIPIVQSMGGQTTNVIFNYYKILVDNNRYDRELNIYDFVSDILNLDVRTISSSEFNLVVSKKVTEIFHFMDIEVISIPFTEECLAIKREYEHALFDKAKSVKAIDNDVRTISYLSDRDQHKDQTSGLRNEPVIITWDKTFYSARKYVIENLVNKGYWYIYSPSKYADRLSVQNFQLNPKAINNNLVSLTELNFNTSSKTTFLDLMSNLFKAEDLTKISVAHRLIEFENSTKPKHEEPTNESLPDDSPLIKVLTELRTHYSSKSNKYGIDELVLTLENNHFAEEVYSLIIDSVTSWSSTNKINKTLFDKFDELIVQSIKE